MVLMSFKRLLPALLAPALLTACGAAGGEADTASPHVVAAFYPLEWASTQVLGDHGSVTTLTAPGAEAHDLELTPRQIASLAEADLVVYLKGFQPAVDDAIEQSGADHAFDVGGVVDLLSAEDGHSHDHGEEGGDDSDAEEEHAEDDGHDHGDFDPHFWQDPERMQVLVTALGDRLAASDPDNSADYASNAATTVEKLARLDGEFQAGLAQCKRPEFMTTHAAFGYLADRYNLTEIGVSGVNPDDEPSPARIAEIHKEAQVHGLTTVFFETLTSNSVAEAIAGDLGLETAVLDPLEGITEKSPGDDYPSIMRANLEALRVANGCS